MLSWKEQSQYYASDLHEWVRNSEVSLTNGANLAHGLRDTLHGAMAAAASATAAAAANANAPANAADPNSATAANEGALLLGSGVSDGSGEEAYAREVSDLYKMMMDGLMSSVHRSIPFYHINRSLAGGFHVTRDEEETQLRADPFESDEDEDDAQSDTEPSSLTDKHGHGGHAHHGAHGQQPSSTAPLTTTNPPPPTPQETRARKREEMRKRRQEDEELLLHKRQVKDDKGHVLDTIGPHPAPRLVIRSAKPTQSFPSRKTLQQRLQVDQAIDLSDRDNESDDEEEEAAKAGSSTGAGSSSGAAEVTDAVVRLTEFMGPLSMDSLKKISESAKVRIKASLPAEEFIHQIVKAAVRSGCDKAFVLSDKNTFIDAMTTHASLAARPSIELLRTLPQDLRDSLGPALGLTTPHGTEYDLWERIVALGLLSVLNNLRLRPLKKITQELGLQLSDMDTTEKYCEAILFAVFPKEKQRIKNSKRAKKNMGVAFNAPAARMRCIGNMGLIAFKVMNISKMRKDSERHYSPEFEFGGLKWSLLCMANKESLALYLCQTGTVYCKFFIQLINTEPDDTIGNEGTQRFTSASQENDWGFNNIIKFDLLLEAKQGFWEPKDDSILIELGIVFVENPKNAPGGNNAAIAGNNTANNNNQNANNNGAANNNGGGGGAGGNNNTGGGGGNNKKNNRDRINEDVAAHAAQLLEQERLEKERKRLKNLLSSCQKEEERLRKDIAQKGVKTIADCIDSHKQEVKRIQKEQKEAERREQQERAREQERIQKAQEQNEEMRRKIAALTAEDVEIASKRKIVLQEAKDDKADLESTRAQLAAVDEEMQSLQSKIRQQEKRLRERQETLAKLREREPPTPEEDPLEQHAQRESEIFASVRESIATLLDN